jgi:hypothetical protein
VARCREYQTDTSEAVSGAFEDRFGGTVAAGTQCDVNGHQVDLKR